MPPEEKKQALLEHLRELRRCLIRAFMALAVGMGAALFFARQIFETLQRPLVAVLPAGSNFIATNPLEAVITYLKVSLLTGLFSASPFVFYQIWRFVAPGLYRKERASALGFVFASSLCFVGGGIFGYFVVFPVGFRFFVTVLEGTGIEFLPQMGSYLGFVSKMLLSFGLVFELPVLLVFLARIGLVTHPQLSRARRYVIVLAFLAAGILTPGPDILSQFLLAIPLLLLYELSLAAIWLLEKRRK